MKEHCTYHPTKPALWHCESCNGFFCQDCITEKSSGLSKRNDLHLCPKCNLPVTRLGISNLIEPFWLRMPKFFSYPLEVQPIIIIVALSIIVAALFSEGGRINGLLIAIDSLVMMKYSFEALKRTAQGDLTPPEISQETVSADFQVVFKVSIIYSAIFFVFFLLVGTFNFAIGIVGLSILMLLLPAMIIVLATSSSFFKAINPFYFARLAFRMGKGYPIMYFFCQTLQAAPIFIIWILHPYLPHRLTILFYSLALNYYTLVSFHLMGYAILQYHKEIGYELAFEDKFIASHHKSAPMGKEKVLTNLTNRVNICIKDGKIDEAIQLIKQETKGIINDPELSEKYYQLLKIGQKTPELIAHGRQYLEQLGKSSRKDAMCAVYRECYELDPTFNPGGAMVMKIANQISSTGDPREAINILNRFIKADPHDPEVPHAYLLAANIFTSRLTSPEKAVKILHLLRSNYPGHEIIPEVEQILQKINLAYGIS
jgi:tetratricopeptide (TPR) repeat protein